MTRQAWTVFVAAVAVAATIGVTACIISYDADEVELNEPQDTAARIHVVSPVPNAEVGDFLEVHLRLENLTLVEKWGEANVEGEGHLSVYIDDHPVAAPGEGIAIPDFAVGVAGLGASTNTNHVLRIQVLNNDRTPYEGIDLVEITWVKLPRTTAPPTNGTGNGTGTPAE